MTKTSPRKLNRNLVMDRWLRILEDEPPRLVDAPILYHYTDAFGVHGIISSNCLWATAAQFSNDLSEIEYAVSIANEVIEEMWGQKKRMSPWEELLVGHLIHLFATPLHAFGQPFIVSFCEQGDLLSQWRAYGATGGFSLAFSPLCQDSEIRLICEEGFRTLVKRVIYDQGEQRARLRFLLKHLITLVNGFSFAIASPQGESAHAELSLFLILEMTDWACTVKHQAFSEEKEWRIVTYPRRATLVGARPENYQGVSVRPTARLLLPYMVLNPPSRKRLPLTEVRCGPSRFQEQSSRAVEILLRKHGYKNIPVTFSGTPLLV